MDKEQRLTYINAMIVCAQIECAGMVADNENSKVIGHSMVHNKEDFDRVINKYGIHHNAVISYFERD